MQRDHDYGKKILQEILFAVEMKSDKEYMKIPLAENEIYFKINE